MTTFYAITGLATVFALTIVFRVLWRENFSIPSIAFGVGMLLLVAEAILGTLGFSTSSIPNALAFMRWRLLVVALLPGAWLLFALTYSRGNYYIFLRKWKGALIAFFVLPPLTAIVWYSQLIVVPADSVPFAGMAGRALHVFLIIGATAVLMNLERTFRASAGVMRWQLKYMVVGMAALFLARIYSSSQALLYSSLSPSLALFDMLALCAAAVLALISVYRAKAFGLDLQPSQTLIYQSLTVLVVGGYLLAVGFLAKAVSMFGGTWGFPIQAFFIFVGLIGLGMLLLSDRVRLRGKRFISRHLRKPVHNFREVWTAFSERTAGQVDPTELCRVTVKWIAETLDVLSVTAWLVPQGETRLVFAASTALTESNAERLVEKSQGMSEALEKLRQNPFPIDMDETRQPWVAPLRELQPIQFAGGANRVCVPIVAGDGLFGLITVADRVGKIPLSVEDLDLLKCVGDHVARDLATMRLSNRLAEAKELQAFQTMATFFIHDLKNTAWTMSLLVQNLREHFDRPDFRDDAVRAVSTSVSRMNELISRLTSLRQELQLNRKPEDLSQLVESALKEFEVLPDVILKKDLAAVPAALIDREQIQKVISNLIINARDAMKPGGEIRVQTEANNGHAVLMVCDNGCGMSPAFIKQRLFRPFQTTKKKGIGIGMFQSKMIIEAHEGRIQVDSAEGAGTTVRITLPLAGGEK